MDSESSGVWIPIIEYSVKTGVSLSTIRRKIKSNTIPYRLEKGKYLILFGATETSAPFNVNAVAAPATAPTAKPAPVQQQAMYPPPPAPLAPPKPIDETVRMVTDAFEYAMKEKEERIRLLEKRNRDLESHLDELRLLVQVLEEKYEVRY